MKACSMIFCVALALTSGALTSAADRASETFPVGVSNVVSLGAESARPLKMRVWYPTLPDRKAEEIAQGIFTGFRAALEAPPRPGSYPLILLSHGYGGNLSNQAWLAIDLAARGAVVAAVNHPDTTSQDLSSDPTLRDRPLDLSRMIDHLTGASPMATFIDRKRIAAIGHSLGGYTVLSAGGARFDVAEFRAYCTSYPLHEGCDANTQNRLASQKRALEVDLRDPRIAAVVALDSAFARAFSPASLAAFPLPTLIVGTGALSPLVMPTVLTSRVMAERMPPARTRYIEIADAGHYSFLPECLPGAETVLKARLCADGGGRTRAELHKDVSAAIQTFLTEREFFENP